VFHWKGFFLCINIESSVKTPQNKRKRKAFYLLRYLLTHPGVIIAINFHYEEILRADRYFSFYRRFPGRAGQ
jgi:hypothetical protein